MPCLASRAEILGPTPHNSIVRRWPMTSNQLAAVSRNTPRGLPNPVAIFARILLSPIPTEQCSRVAASTSVCTRRANVSGSPVRTPTNASSQPRTSTTTPSMPRSAPMTCAEAASYAAASTGRMTALGALRAASRNDIPEPTPKARAS
jgi:hypothetical protein